MRCKRTVFGLSLCAVLLAGARTSQADFTLTTTTSSVTLTGLTHTGNLTAGSTITIDGSTLIVGAGGGFYAQDAAGTTVYLLNDSRTAGTTAVANEQIFVVNTTPGAVDTGMFSFTMAVSVTNNSDTKTFTLTSNTASLNLTGGNTNYTVNAGALAPPSQTIGGLLFSATNPQGLSGSFNSLNTGGVSLVITAVPEPSTLALLGVGGLLVVAPRLRRAVRRLGASA